ncbi:gamma-aminobutyric acid type B receptor subunit 2-like isoform X3 [Nerophis lumbriciformis]|uniref:gamma-aminobutyric acid type B receptor subunit 2-like isoform X3 n=1 Tax=Nerophis lumbriciformis TaxID=546530 RepID=UPI002AE03A6A|nr:gamma-aminobutyric acid type B receptor subunit 2-like isoform X3 [Nerophis lumbriciformis]
MSPRLRCLLFYFLLPGPVAARVRHPLPVLWMRPAGHGGGVNETVQQALRDLKKQAPPLGNYELQLHAVDSKCDTSAALKALFDAMWAGPEYRLLFGGACPSVTPLLARALPALRMVQVTFSAPGRKWYRNTFSTAPSRRAVNQAAVKLLQRYRWTRVGIIAQEGSSEMAEDLSRHLMKARLELVSMATLHHNDCTGLMDIMERDVRVFIVLAPSDEDSVSQVFCCASRLKLSTSGHQWVVAGGGDPGWRSRSRVSVCTWNEVMAVADGAIWLQTTRVVATPRLPGRVRHESFFAGVCSRVTVTCPQTPQEALHLQQSAKVNPLHAFAYDAVWVAAIALSEATEAVKRREKYAGVGEEEVARALHDAVKRTHFDGVTVSAPFTSCLRGGGVTVVTSRVSQGSVSFQDGDRVTAITVLQSQGEDLVMVGEFLSDTRHLRLAEHLVKFKDPTPMHEERRHANVLLPRMVAAVAAVTAALSLTALCITTIKRHASATHDALLLLAVLLSTSSVMAACPDDNSLPQSTLNLLCSVRLWLLSLGQTLGFSAVFTRTWRHFSPGGVVPPPCYVASILALLDVFVLTTWQMVDPLRRVVMRHRPQGDSAPLDVVSWLPSDGCSSNNMEEWTAFIYAYKAALLGVGCFVAWNIRRRSTVLAFSMSAVAAVSVAGACAWPLLAHNPSLHFCVTSALVLACDLLVLAAMFEVRIGQLHGGGGGAPEGGATRGEAAEALNRRLKQERAELDARIDTLCHALEAQLAQSATGSCSPLKSCVRDDSGPAAEAGSEVRENPTDVNAPDLVRRRLSVQLPILHHSYLAVIGGVSASSSAHFGSREMFNATSVKPQL